MRVKFLTMPVFGAESHFIALSRALGLGGQGTAQHSSALRHCLGKAVALSGQEASLQMLLISHLPTLSTLGSDGSDT